MGVLNLSQLLYQCVRLGLFESMFDEETLWLFSCQILHYVHQVVSYIVRSKCFVHLWTAGSFTTAAEKGRFAPPACLLTDSYSHCTHAHVYSLRAWRCARRYNTWQQQQWETTLLCFVVFVWTIWKKSGKHKTGLRTASQEHCQGRWYNAGIRFTYPAHAHRVCPDPHTRPPHITPADNRMQKVGIGLYCVCFFFFF